MKTLLYSLMLMQMEAERDRPGEDSLPPRPCWSADASRSSRPSLPGSVGSCEAAAAAAAAAADGSVIPRTAIATAEETIAAAAEWPGEGCAICFHSTTSR